MKEILMRMKGFGKQSLQKSIATKNHALASHHLSDYKHGLHLISYWEEYISDFEDRILKLKNTYQE
jgi:hypothetical protein